MRFIKVLVTVFALMGSAAAHAGPNYLSGNITNITSVSAGVMIMLDTGVPDNCAGTSYNWMLIKDVDRSMISVALTMWATNNRHGVVYTNARTGSYCEINQLDPDN